ncbi:hypothetical protein HanPI659440_Chr01g0000671 [Helianthus annuus]|nr:hypothetical protein HanPI659440_Chr01g0000671 [Helianthus annuus]
MEMEIKKANGVSDVGAWAMNVVSSVGIIMTNKQLMSSTGYAFTFGNYSLSQLHLICTPIPSIMSSYPILSLIYKTSPSPSFTYPRHLELAPWVDLPFGQGGRPHPLKKNLVYILGKKT